MKSVWYNQHAFFYKYIDLFSRYELFTFRLKKVTIQFWKICYFYIFNIEIF